MNKYKAIGIIIALIGVIFGAIFGANKITESESLNISEKKEGTLLVHYIDVGQADCAYIELPDGKTMVIDAGEADSGEKVRKYIEQRGTKRIDFLVGTHPHSDHIGGLRELVESFEIGEIYMPKVTHTSKTFENLLIAIKEKGETINTAKAGENICKTEDLSIDILSPVREEYEELNDYSAVIKITYKDTAFLFTGDAENRALTEIEGDVSADVLKVAHHGSSTSDDEAFMKRVNPGCAIISVGKDNSYGHPHREVTALLKEIGAKVYRTDESGTIIAETDGKEIKITTLGE